MGSQLVITMTKLAVSVLSFLTLNSILPTDAQQNYCTEETKRTYEHANCQVYSS